MINKRVDEAIVQNLIEPDSRKEFLNAVFPPESSEDAKRFFNFLKAHVVLKSNGMGVELREDRADIALLLEKEGFRYEYYRDFIDLYESEIWKQEYDREKTKKK